MSWKAQSVTFCPQYAAMYNRAVNGRCAACSCIRWDVCMAMALIMHDHENANDPQARARCHDRVTMKRHGMPAHALLHLARVKSLPCTPVRSVEACFCAQLR